MAKSHLSCSTADVPDTGKAMAVLPIYSLGLLGRKQVIVKVAVPVPAAHELWVWLPRRGWVNALEL